MPDSVRVAFCGLVALMPIPGKCELSGMGQVVPETASGERVIQNNRLALLAEKNLRHWCKRTGGSFHCAVVLLSPFG